MNESYEQELQMGINFLYKEIAYLQDEIENARRVDDTDEYTRLMRICLPVQKQYLKLCAEQEKRESAESDPDPLAAFNAQS